MGFIFFPTNNIHFYETSTGEKYAVNPEKHGTKCAPHYILEIPGGQEFVIKARLFEKSQGPEPELMFSKEGFDDVFALRIHEADEFYEEVMDCYFFSC